MAIDDYKHHGLDTEESKQHARKAIRENYERKYASDGPVAAAELLAKHKVTPSADDERAARAKSNRATYEQLKVQNPAAAADFGNANPDVYAEGIATPTKQRELEAVAGRAWGTRPDSAPDTGIFERAADRLRGTPTPAAAVVVTPAEVTR